jgi:DNA-binding CsgD family transcriptional regulator
MPKAAVPDTVQRLAAAQTEADIVAACRLFAHEHGFEFFIYAYRAAASFVDAHVLQISGYPPAWLERYWREDFVAVDPVVAHCSRSVLPVVWSELAPPTHGTRMMNEAGEFGLRSGISVPMHGPEGELGILSLAHAGPGRPAGRAIERVRPLIHGVAAHVHEAVRRVSRVAEDGDMPELSGREQECLRWASDGKTSWEIGVILGISERTVNFHLDNAATKLKAVNRQHALARAIALRTIRPRPF